MRWSHTATAIAALAAALVVGASAAPRTVAVQLLAINDFHGNLQPPDGTNGLVNGVPAGGAAYLATHIARAIARNPNSVVVSAGDVVGASPLVSSLFHDEPTIEAMNAMHLAVSSVGNHEFDQPAPEMLRLVRGGCHPVDGCAAGSRFSGARFQYLSANVVDARTRTPHFPATTVRTVGGVKIGFIGETLRGTPSIASPAGTRGLEFLDEATTANQYAQQLERQGVHTIVLLIHEGGQQNAAGAIDPNGCASVSGGIVRIAAQLGANIPVVISGHTHRFYNCRIDGHLVTSAAAFGRVLTRITLDAKSDRLIDMAAENEVVTRDVPPDPAQAQLLERYERLSGSIAERPVGSLSADIRRAQNAAGESPLGEVVADAELAAASGSATGAAVVAFMNSGGIRADLARRSAEASGQPDVLTYRDVFAVAPFPDALAVVTLTGAQLREILEQQFDNPQPGNRQILQISAGFTYSYRLMAAKGAHIVEGSMQVNGRPIGPSDRLRVAAPDFVIDSGQFPALSEGTERLGGVSNLDALLAYLQAHSPLGPGPADRITRID